MFGDGKIMQSKLMHFIINLILPASDIASPSPSSVNNSDNISVRLGITSQSSLTTISVVIIVCKHNVK